jgi:ubiquinone/menaquinone biosynthesis C-methylase UbiE
VKKAEQYNTLAGIYDRLMNHVNYKRWAAYISEILSTHIPTHSLLLELAAGTGKFSTYLSSDFPNLVLSDLSVPMLKVAGQRVDFPLVAADFRALPFKTHAFDGVICLYDSINYLLRLSEVEKMIQNVSEIIAPGGIFIFDCCLINGSRAHAEVGSRVEYFRGVELRQHSYRVEEKNVHINTFYLKNNIGEVFQETHRQKIYRLTQFKKILLNCGFELLHCYDNDSFSEATENSFRAHFVTRKL